MCSNTIVRKEDEAALQQDLHTLSAWEIKWSMEFHPQKCSTLRVSRKREKTTPSYHLHGQTLENVTTTKYLGVTIQDNLQWDTHIDTITKKANKTLGFVRRTLKIGNKRTKETAYKALVRPLLEYASTVWDPYTAQEVNALEKVQRRAVKIMGYKPPYILRRNDPSVTGMALPTRSTAENTPGDVLQISPWPHLHQLKIPAQTFHQQTKQQNQQPADL